LATEE
jgi:hypothetical protein